MHTLAAPPPVGVVGGGCTGVAAANRKSKEKSPHRAGLPRAPVFAVAANGCFCCFCCFCGGGGGGGGKHAELEGIVARPARRTARSLLATVSDGA